jgi:outer membrane protein assembly factor BamA
MFRFCAVRQARCDYRRVGARIGLVALVGLAPARLAAQDEGLVIRRLDFKGNRSIDGIALQAAISTTKSAWFASSRLVRWLGLGEERRLNESEFRRDVARIRLFYQINGFLDAKVDTTVVRTAKDVYITFRITEGEPTRVNSLTVAGMDSLVDRDKVVQDLPLRVGMPYNRYLLLSTADTIQTRLWNRGYPTASVLLGRRDVDRAKRTADLELVADLGAAAVIGPIKIEGSSQVDATRTCIAVSSTCISPGSSDTRPWASTRLDSRSATPRFR